MSRCDSGFQKLSILCIEDDRDALEFMRSLLVLKFPHADIHTASDGEEGLKIFCEQRPEFVVTDLSLPLLDGATLACRIRDIDSGAKIIAVSAHSDVASLKASEGQFDCYLLKPLDFKELAKTIETLLTSCPFSNS